MGKEDMAMEGVSSEEGKLFAGLAVSLISILIYVAIVLIRVFTDDVSFTAVAWEWPMFWVLLAGGLVAGAIEIVAKRKLKGITRDERDEQIERYGEKNGAGLLMFAVFVTLLLLIFGVGTFWVAQNLFFGSWFANVIGAASRLAAYREGIPAT